MKVDRRLALACVPALLALPALPAPARVDPPPRAQQVRVIAEWEPALGTLIRWPLGIPQALAIELAEDDMLYVLVNQHSAGAQALASLTSWGVDPAHIEIILCPIQTVWPRDWGPHQVFDEQGQWCIVDPIFQGYPWVGNACVPITSPGGHLGDDQVNVALAQHFGAPLIPLPAYLTGGNFLVDGQRAAFSTCAMIGENEQLWTPQQFLDLTARSLGTSDYHVLENTEGYGIQHIDCWMKLLDEETLLVKRPPDWHVERSHIDANLRAIAGLKSCTGKPYRVVRIDCPPYSGSQIAAYTNSLILNDKVLVPLFNIAADQQALETYRRAMPGYEVIGFPWSGWHYYDALHCRTRALFDPNMLHLGLARRDDRVRAGAAARLVVRIDDRSEAGLIPERCVVRWRVAGEAAWSELRLRPTGEPDLYAAELPGAPAATILEGYVTAADRSGRSATLPRGAPAALYRFAVVE